MIEGRENFQRLLAAMRSRPPAATIVAHPCDASSLACTAQAAELNIISPVLVGPRQRVLDAAAAAKVDVSAWPLVESLHSHDSAAKAVAQVREGRGEMLMKGSLGARRSTARPRSCWAPSSGATPGCAPNGASATASSWTCRATPGC